MNIVRTLIIGIGGIGGLITNRVKEEILKKTNGKELKAIQFLYFDSTFNDLFNYPGKVVLDEREEMKQIKVNFSDNLSLFKNPDLKEVELGGKEYTLSEVITDIYKEEFEHRKDVKAGCGGLPIICRASLLVNDQLFQEILEVFRKKLQVLLDIYEIEKDLKSINPSYSLDKSYINVYLINSLGGGTGRGSYELLTVLLKLSALSLNIPLSSLRFRLITVLPIPFRDESLPGYTKKNTYAA